MTTRALIAGWFSFPNGHPTAGDLLSGRLVRDWLGDAGIANDIAIDSPFTGGVDWRRVDPRDYSHLVFVCGPWGRGELEAQILIRFAACRLVGLSLSMTLPLAMWNPFDLLIERDSDGGANVDLVFGSHAPLPPIIGVCLVEEHPEAEVTRANGMIDAFLATREGACVMIDTRLDSNEAGLRTPGEVEALIARVDVLVTTRLHGLVLAVKNGIPAIAIDAVPGGGKIKRQCELVGWPCVFTLDRLDTAAFDRAFAYVLSPEGRAEARDCAKRAEAALAEVRARLMSSFGPGSTNEGAFQRRTNADGLADFRAFLETLLPSQEAPPPRQGRRARLWRRARSVVSRF